MPINPNIIRCLSDVVTQVRDAETGRLLGCIPKLSGEPDVVTTSSGTTFELRYAMTLAVAVARGQDPLRLDGFVPAQLDNLDLALPPEADDDEEGVL